jgi:hypothetical protein
MENIIATPLETLKEEIGKKIAEHKTLNQGYLENKAKCILVPISNLFDEYSIFISDNRINFTYIKDSWYSFQIERTYDWEGKKYEDAYVSSSSSSSNTEQSLKRYICLGELANQKLNKTNEWYELVSLMDEYNKLDEDSVKPLRNQLYDIENAISEINKNKKIKNIQNILNKEIVKFKESVSFWFGNGKWDRVHSDTFSWKENKGGKTYNVFYTEQIRINSIFDQDGNRLEGIYENKTYELPKRIKKDNLISFLSCNMNHII